MARYSCSEALVYKEDHVAAIFIPYIEQVHNALSKSDAPALAVMDNFKGQVTESVYTCVPYLNLTM